MELIGNERRLRVVDGAFTSVSRNEAIGTFVKREGDLIFIRFDNGTVLPFHYSRLEEPGLSVAKMLTDNVSKAQNLIRKNAVEDYHSEVIGAFETLLAIIDNPSLAEKNKQALDDLRLTIKKYRITHG